MLNNPASFLGSSFPAQRETLLVSLSNQVDCSQELRSPRVLHSSLPLFRLLKLLPESLPASALSRATNPILSARHFSSGRRALAAWYARPEHPRDAPRLPR